MQFTMNWVHLPGKKQYGDLIEKKFIETKILYRRECIIGETANTADFIVEDSILLELKAKHHLTNDDYDQVERYLYVTNLKLAILVNFRTKYITPKRVINKNL